MAREGGIEGNFTIFPESTWVSSQIPRSILAEPRLLGPLPPSSSPQAGDDPYYRGKESDTGRSPLTVTEGKDPQE